MIYHVIAEAPTVSNLDVDHQRHDESPHPRLTHAIRHASHLLPAQGPITVFIHHNTLHAFEEKLFHEAVQQGAQIFGCEPYLTEERFRRKLTSGRIPIDGLRIVLRSELGSRADDPVVGNATRLDIRLCMLLHPIFQGPSAELSYYMAESDALHRLRSDVSPAARNWILAKGRHWTMRDLRDRSQPHPPAWFHDLIPRLQAKDIESWDEPKWESFITEAMWTICRHGVGTVTPSTPPNRLPVRHRDWLKQAFNVDADLLVNDFLIRYVAAFLDQGLAHWPLPHREEGLYRSFLRIYSQPGGPPDLWLRGLIAEAQRLLKTQCSPLDSIRDSLDALGVTEDEWDDYFSALLLSLRGWAGMVREMEVRGDRVAYPIAEGSLVEFVAIRLILDRLAICWLAANQADDRGPLRSLRERLRQKIRIDSAPTLTQRTYPVFQLAQLMGWSPEDLTVLTPSNWERLVGEMESFGSIERRRIFHLAYERGFRMQSLDAMALHPRKATTRSRPRFQTFVCLDEREESFRRHLEEVAPDTETFGMAGFFNVAMYYRGTTDAYFVPLCPIVVTPNHWVAELAGDGHEKVLHQHAWTRKLLGSSMHHLNVGTRSVLFGALLSAGLGVFASIPLVLGILFPRLAAKLRDKFSALIHKPPHTRLKIERNASESGQDHLALGFRVDEMADVAEQQLRDIGLTDQFAPLVFILGHGSSSLNNPHKSAYDCGACGGSPGAANGRSLAQMLNDPRVRQMLGSRGIVVPDDTWFVGGFHNTGDDSVSFFDLDLIPARFQSAMEQARRDFEESCRRNAHERCRRFMSAPLGQTLEEARRHVENRTEDLAQVRPELGHATNALCVVARRERTRGLFLDRRAFLTSYDPTQDDPNGTTLERLLAAAVPVCAGISLEYYFSHVDSMGYGCGTKLPHNVSSLIGVMDGAASDLRTGLPWQMTEIHEPVRLLFVIETTPGVIRGIMDRNAMIRKHIENEWIQTTLLDPESNQILLYQNGGFVPYEPQSTSLPRAANSIDWYRGWRGHLEFAEIDSGATSP
ncbi:MAG: DUF2309 domain-containing protein [Gemmataceae bacterium]